MNKRDPFKTLADKPDDVLFAVDMGDPTPPLFMAPAPRPGVELFGAVPVPITEDGVNYRITTELGTAVLKRGVDFAKVGKQTKPSLLKAGAEKLATQLGLLQHYTIEASEEHFTGDPPFCFYRVRCDLDKIGPDGKIYTICTGYGSANTREARNGKNDVWNAANATLKMASKRALVAAALSVSSASGLFYQDLEDGDYNDSGTEALKQTKNPAAALTLQQMKHIYALAAEQGLTTAQAQDKIISAGWKTMKDIKQNDYAAVCELFTGAKNDD